MHTDERECSTYVLPRWGTYNGLPLYIAYSANNDREVSFKLFWSLMRKKATLSPGDFLRCVSLSRTSSIQSWVWGPQQHKGIWNSCFGPIQVKRTWFVAEPRNNLSQHPKKPPKSLASFLNLRKCIHALMRRKGNQGCLELYWFDSCLSCYLLMLLPFCSVWLGIIDPCWAWWLPLLAVPEKFVSLNCSWVDSEVNLTDLKARKTKLLVELHADFMLGLTVPRYWGKAC